MFAKVRRNPRHDAVRKAIDSVSFALSSHDIWVSEFQNPDGSKGAEYVVGFGRDGQVVATLDGQLKWVDTAVTQAQSALVEAHAKLFPNL